METHKVRVRIAELIEAKSARDGKRVTQEMISQETGIPQGTLSRWAGNKVDRLDKTIMVKLCLYFECEIGDLLVMEMQRQ